MSTKIEVTSTLKQELSDALRGALKRVRAERAGQQAEAIILRRTQRGEFLQGSSSGASSYSTKPFARPAGGLTERVYDRVSESDRVKYFTSSSGDEWLVFEGGYKQLRQMMGLPTANVDLNVTGQTLQGMRVRVTREGDGVSIEIGYIEGLSPQEAIQVAEYHNRLGAGKNKVLRKFVGLTSSESDDVVSFLEKELERELDL